MNDLDNLMPHENDDADQEMTDDELALYLEILASAYPNPKTDLKEAVAAKIREEQELPSQAKKKSPADKKKITARIVKWGSLAACIAVICLAVIKVIPSLGAKSENLAVSYDAASFDAADEEDAAGCGMTKAMTTSGSSDAPESQETSDETGVQYEAEIRKYNAESYNSLFIGGSSYSADESYAETEASESADANSEDGANGAVPYIASYSVMFSLPEVETEAEKSVTEEPAEYAVEEDAIEEEIEEAVVEEAAAETAEDLLKPELSGEFESDLKQNLIDAVQSAVSENTLPSPDAPLEEIITTLGITPGLFNEILADLTSAYESQYPDTPIPSYNYETITKDTVK